MRINQTVLDVVLTGPYCVLHNTQASLFPSGLARPYTLRRERQQIYAFLAAIKG